MIIRTVTADDFDDIVGMARVFCGDPRYKPLYGTVPTVQVEAFVQQVMDIGEIIVAQVGRRLVGMLAFVVLPDPLTGDRVCMEVAWFVQEDERGASLAGPKMLKELETWCNVRAITMLRMIAPAGGTAGTYYERLGYVAVETSYFKRLGETAKAP